MTTEPPALAPPDHYDPADVAAMLREIGIALVEVSQPVQVVEERLLRIAGRYTTDRVRAAVLPTVLFIQVGSTHEMEGSAQPSSLPGQNRSTPVSPIATTRGRDASSSISARAASPFRPVRVSARVGCSATAA